MKKLFIMFIVVLAVIGSSMTVFAEETCLDVRDYGYHRYNHRFDRRVDTSAEVLGLTGDGYIKVKVYYQDYGFCICGAYGPTVDGTGFYYKNVPMP